MPIYFLLLSLALLPVTALAAPSLKEASGLAMGSNGTLWAQSDGPNIGVKVQDRGLYALNVDGAIERVAQLDVRNNDWEDLASFVEKGKRYLLIADTGDNLGRRTESQLYVVAEPKGEEAVLAWKIRFRYPDEAHDCEAVAVDMENRRVLLITKRDLPAQIYSVAVHGGEKVQEARKVGELWPLPKASMMAAVFHPMLGNYAHQPTAMDISADNRMAVVLTYRAAYLWHRLPGQPWEEQLAREPDQVISLPGIGQYEGVAFSLDGHTLYISQEGENAIAAFPVPSVSTPVSSEHKNSASDPR